MKNGTFNVKINNNFESIQGSDGSYLGVSLLGENGNYTYLVDLVMLTHWMPGWRSQ